MTSQINAGKLEAIAGNNSQHRIPLNIFVVCEWPTISIYLRRIAFTLAEQKEMPPRTGHMANVDCFWHLNNIPRNRSELELHRGTKGTALQIVHRNYIKGAAGRSFYGHFQFLYICVRGHLCSGFVYTLMAGKCISAADSV